MNYPKKNWHASSAAVSGATVSSVLGQFLFWGGSEGSGFSWKQHLISKPFVSSSKHWKITLECCNPAALHTQTLGENIYQLVLPNSNIGYMICYPSNMPPCPGRGPGLCLEFLEIKSHWRNRMNEWMNECLEKVNQMAKIHHQFMIISLLNIFGCIATLAFPESSEATALSRFSRVFALPWLTLAELLPWDAGIGECQWRWDLSHSCCQPRTKMSPHCWFM